MGVVLTGELLNHYNALNIDSGRLLSNSANDLLKAHETLIKALNDDIENTLQKEEWKKCGKEEFVVLFNNLKQKTTNIKVEINNFLIPATNKAVVEGNSLYKILVKLKEQETALATERNTAEEYQRQLDAIEVPPDTETSYSYDSEGKKIVGSGRETHNPDYDDAIARRRPIQEKLDGANKNINTLLTNMGTLKEQADLVIKVITSLDAGITLDKMSIPEFVIDQSSIVPTLPPTDSQETQQIDTPIIENSNQSNTVTNVSTVLEARSTAQFILNNIPSNPNIAAKQVITQALLPFFQSNTPSGTIAAVVMAASSDIDNGRPARDQSLAGTEWYDTGAGERMVFGHLVHLPEGLQLASTDANVRNRAIASATDLVQNRNDYSFDVVKTKSDGELIYFDGTVSRVANQEITTIRLEHTTITAGEQRVSHIAYRVITDSAGNQVFEPYAIVRNCQTENYYKKDINPLISEN